MYDGISKEEVDEYILSHDRDDYEKRIVRNQRRGLVGAMSALTLAGTGAAALGGGDIGIPLVVGGASMGGAALYGNKLGRDRVRRIRTLAENKPLYQQVFNSRYPLEKAPNGKYKYIFRSRKEPKNQQNININIDRDDYFW
nr:MAG TPA: protein of unknown function (DUF3482) [Bacteriophage sp.]